MPSIFQKLASKVGGAPPKTKRVPALFEAGRILLAQYDCHDARVSVVQITKAAKVSLGTFYARFESKDTFIGNLTDSTLRLLLERATRALSDERFEDASVEAIVRKIVHYVVRDLGDPEMAGVIRAALKLAPGMPGITRPLHDYRALIAKRARTLLARHKTSPERVDTAIQILFGTVIDAIIEKPRPLNLGSDEMADTLADMLTGYMTVLPEHGRAKIKVGSRKDKSNGRGNGPEQSEDGRKLVRETALTNSSYSKRAGRDAPKQPQRVTLDASAAEPKTATTKPTSFQLPQSEPDKTDSSAYNKRTRRIRVV